MSTNRHPTHFSDGADRGTKILLTGATGFLGAELLARLLRGRHEVVLCFVRGDDDASARARGDAALARVLGREPTADEAARVEWVRADLEAAGLGLSHQERARIVSEIGEVFHCAASTRFDLPLADAERINVQGVREILDLAREAASDHAFRRLHHVSTAYAAGAALGSIDAGYLPADGPRRFRNSYERTKASAERLLHAQDLVPFTIYRPSIIVGDSRSGRTLNWNVVYPVLRLIDAGLLSYFPSSAETPLDVVPIDFVADGILALGVRPDSAGETYHLTAGPETLTMEEFLTEAYRGVERNGRGIAEVRTRLVGSVKWWLLRCFTEHASSRFSRLSRRDFLLLRRAVRAMQTYAPYGRVRCRFETRREHALLRNAGVRMPVRQGLLGRVFDYAVAHGFGAPGGRTPSEPRQRAAEARTTGRTLVEEAHALGETCLPRYALGE